MLGWTQGDPLFRFQPDRAWVEPRKGNLYQYVLANPVRYTDPDGRLTWDQFFGGVGTAAATATETAAITVLAPVGVAFLLSEATGGSMDWDDWVDLAKQSQARPQPVPQPIAPPIMPPVAPPPSIEATKKPGPGTTPTPSPDTSTGTTVTPPPPPGDDDDCSKAPGAPGSYRPPGELPRQPGGEPAPTPGAEGPHTQIGTKQGSKGPYTQAREFDADGNVVKDIDFTTHGRGHPCPHEHPYNPNPTGGTPARGPQTPLK